MCGFVGVWGGGGGACMFVCFPTEGLGGRWMGHGVCVWYSCVRAWPIQWGGAMCL